MKSEQIDQLAAALSAAQGEMPTAKFNAVNPFLKNKYADLGSVIEAGRHVLPKHGLAVTQLVSGGAQFDQPGAIEVETILMHKSGQWVSSTISLPVGEERGKSQAQVAGSIISYLRRYAYASILGIYAEEDTDGNQPERKQEKKTAAEQKPAELQVVTNSNARPYAPQVLFERIKARAKYHMNDPVATDQLRQIIASTLDSIFDGDKTKRYELCKWLTGEASTKHITDGYIYALQDWLTVTAYGQPPVADAIAEARAALGEALKASGQQELL